jgi:hypothetical protein
MEIMHVNAMEAALVIINTVERNISNCNFLFFRREYNNFINKA